MERACPEPIEGGPGGEVPSSPAPLIPSLPPSAHPEPVEGGKGRPRTTSTPHPLRPPPPPPPPAWSAPRPPRPPMRPPATQGSPVNTGVSTPRPPLHHPSCPLPCTPCTLTVDRERAHSAIIDLPIRIHFSTTPHLATKAAPEYHPPSPRLAPPTIPLHGCPGSTAQVLPPPPPSDPPGPSRSPSPLRTSPSHTNRPPRPPKSPTLRTSPADPRPSSVPDPNSYITDIGRSSRSF
ncbi:MAG: homeobox protein ESX1 [Chloroflexi bacterium]|nr:MAG: homeobox protein ESX1 [Chloroflexota bacterium]